MQYCRYTGGAVAPIEARNRKLADSQCFREVNNILDDGGQLRHARGIRIKEASWPIASKVGHENPVSG